LCNVRTAVLPACQFVNARGALLWCLGPFLRVGREYRQEPRAGTNGRDKTPLSLSQHIVSRGLAAFFLHCSDAVSCSIVALAHRLSPSAHEVHRAKHPASLQPVNCARCSNSADETPCTSLHRTRTALEIVSQPTLLIARPRTCGHTTWTDYVFSLLAAMTPNVSLPPRVLVQDDSQHHDDHLVQRLKAMPTSLSRSGPTPVRSPVKTPSFGTETIQEDASFSTMYSRKQASAFTQDTDAMGDANPLARQLSNTSDESITSRRPKTPRAQTDPSSSELSSLYRPQQRNRSPYSRPHLRSHSSSGSLSAPPMTRAHSLPTVMHPGSHLTLSPSPSARPSSPMRSPKRTRSPRELDARPFTTGLQERYGSGIRPASLGSFEGSPSVCDISEDAELELTPRAGVTMPSLSLYSTSGSLSRRRRPASPLHHVSLPFGVPPTSTPTVSTPTSGASSPLLAPAKFNEHYPSSLASSSVPSTPTSMRSRSPSISSLETIEDSPDAEEEAIEAERIAKLKAAADREDGGDQRRSSMDVPERGRTFGFGKRDSRKRWSVCGAERRGDLDLETIWED
jgi:hypothetical protein